jgi:predicted metal-dependent peptidase
MREDPNIQRASLGLRMSAPFFAGLLLFADVQPKIGLGTAATDGKTIFYDPAYLTTLTVKQVQGLLMHEVLHCALQHIPRRQLRDPELWNFAADIVVNGMIASLKGYELPLGAIRRPALEHFCVEEVYAILERTAVAIPTALILDLSYNNIGGVGEGKQEAVNGGESEAYWQHAIRCAQMMAEANERGRGSIPAEFDRELRFAEAPQIDWKTALWRFLVRTPCDFHGYDRRFIHSGLYIDDLAGESLKVHIAIDTSASVSDLEISQFLAEVQSIVGAYPHIDCNLYYADADLHGPYKLDRSTEIPPPKGGGGTSFRPFFEAVEEMESSQEDDLCIYLTDGFGDFPTEAPDYPVMWVLAPGGANDAMFPFGDILRMT